VATACRFATIQRVQNFKVVHPRSAKVRALRSHEWRVWPAPCRKRTGRFDGERQQFATRVMPPAPRKRRIVGLPRPESCCRPYRLLARDDLPEARRFRPYDRGQALRQLGVLFFARRHHAEYCSGLL